MDEATESTAAAAEARPRGAAPDLAGSTDPAFPSGAFADRPHHPGSPPRQPAPGWSRPRPQAASVAERLVALTVDVVVVLGLLAGTLVATSLVLSRGLHVLYRDTVTGGLVATDALVLPLLAALPVGVAVAYLVALPGRRGATLGMRLVGVEVSLDVPGGGRPGAARTGLRLLVWALGVVVIAGPVCTLRSPDRRGWHDRVSGTMVARRARADPGTVMARAA